MAREFKAKSGDEEEEISDFREPDVRRIVDDAQFRLGMIVKIIIIFFLISVVIGGVLLTRNKVVREKISSFVNEIKKEFASTEKVSTTATLQWWKDPSVYGAHPNVRYGGPYDVKILRNDGICLNFATSHAVFKGEKSGGRFDGTWNQQYPEEDGGNWYSTPDSSNPRMFQGKYTDRSGEWINFSLKIDLK